MTMTEQEVKKSVADANTAAAVAALEQQVAKSAAAYNAMNQSARGAASQGAQNIQNRMAAAGVQRPMTETAGKMLEMAAGGTIQANRTAKSLGDQQIRANADYMGAKGQQTADKLQKQAAEAKADTLAQYGDFSGYGDLGFSAEQQQRMKQTYDRENAKSEAFGGLGKYAESLLDLYAENAGFDINAGLQEALDNGLITQQDYLAATIAAKGIVGGSKAKKTGKETGTNPGNPADLTPEEKAAAGRMTARDDGKFVISDPKDWSIIADYYKRNGQLSYFAQNYVFVPNNDADLAYVPGYGEITWEEAYELERQGVVGITLDDNGKEVFYQRKPGTISNQMQR